MRITEKNLENFANFVALFKNKQKAFKQFQQEENQRVFASNKESLSERNCVNKVK